ncbi:hypothetical protein Ancab_025071 [Ancistrocladus abbreviatus]
MKEGEITTLVQVWSTVFASLCYCYFIVSKIPKGKFRLFSLLPIFCLFTILPIFLSSVFLAGNTAFFITWLGNFKLLLYAFNLGPLSQTSSFPIFILTAAFPIKIRPKKRHPSKKILQNKEPRKSFLSFWSKFLILSILIYACDHYKDGVPSPILILFYGCMLYLFIDIVLGICNKLVGPILGVELDPPSDEPYLSTSLEDFWGRRWNRMVSDTLRNTTYLPVRSAFGKKQWARILAVVVTFAVSGLVHELIFYYMTRVSPTWEVTWFFVLNGLCMAVETSLKRALGRRWSLHWILSGPLTIGFVTITGCWWFYPPLLRNHVDVKAIEECTTLARYVKGIFL